MRLVQACTDRRAITGKAGPLMYVAVFTRDAHPQRHQARTYGSTRQTCAVSAAIDDGQE